MLTRYISEITTAFNPFVARSKGARLFLSMLPGSARQGVKIDTKMMPRTSNAKSSLKIKFKDGKVMDLDVEKLGIKGITEEVNRHSRVLARQDEINA